MGIDIRKGIAYEYEKEQEWDKKHHKQDEEWWYRIDVILIVIALLAFFIPSPFRYIVWGALILYYVYHKYK